MTRTERERLENTTHCRCGCKWSEHPTEWNLRYMQPNCCLCGNVIGYSEKQDGEYVFIPTQCRERYIDKGNFCDKCSASFSK